MFDRICLWSHLVLGFCLLEDFYRCLVCGYHEALFSNIYMIILSCWSLKFEHILTILHFYCPPPNFYCFYMIFTSFCFVYPLTAYSGYKGMILLFLSFNLPTSFISGWAITVTVYLAYQWDFSICNFHTVVVVAFSFPFREVPLTFLLKLVLWCWTLLVFACL